VKLRRHGEEIRTLAARFLPLFSCRTDGKFLLHHRHRCVLLALPSNEINSLQGLVQAIGKTADRVRHAGSAAIGGLSDCVSNIGVRGISGCGRTPFPFVAGIDRFLPPAFGASPSPVGTPWVALLTQTGHRRGVHLSWAGRHIGQGAYDVLVSMGVITYFHSLSVSVRLDVQLQRGSCGIGRDSRSGGKPVLTRSQL